MQDLKKRNRIWELYEFLKGDQTNTEITDTICGVDENQWENLTGNIYMERSYPWFKTIEESGMRDMHYVLVRENKNLVAAACCYPYQEDMYGIHMPFLEVRSPLGTSLTLYLKTSEHGDALLKGLNSIHKNINTKGTLILDLKQNEFIKIQSHISGLPKMRIPSNTYIDLKFDTFENYLQSLSSRNRRSIRNTLNKADRWDIKPVFTSEFSKWKNITSRLQKYVCEKYGDHRYYLTEKFYDALERNLKDNAELAIFIKDDIPLAFGLALNSSDITQYKFVGIDPEYQKYQAYFLIYYEGIKRAIEHGKSRIYFGPSSYSFKERIGCRREELFGLVSMKNPLLHLILKSYLAFCWWRGIKF